MSTVRQLLKEKGSTVWSVTPDTTVYEALQVLANRDIGAVLVSENDSILGIFSERDYARKVVLQGKTSKEIPISELMSVNVYSVDSEATLEQCMSLMTERRIRHLPVLNDGKLSGMITIGDVVKELIMEQEGTISDLRRYIYAG